MGTGQLFIDFAVDKKTIVQKERDLKIASVY